MLSGYNPPRASQSNGTPFIAQRFDRLKSSSRFGRQVLENYASKAGYYKGERHRKP